MTLSKRQFSLVCIINLIIVYYLQLNIQSNLSSCIESYNGTNLITIYLDYAMLITIIFSITSILCFQMNSFILLKLFKLCNYFLFISCYILIVIIYTHFILYNENANQDVIYAYINFTFVKLIHCYQINLIDDFIGLIKKDNYNNMFDRNNLLVNINLNIKYLYSFQTI